MNEKLIGIVWYGACITMLIGIAVLVGVEILKSLI